MMHRYSELLLLALFAPVIFCQGPPKVSLDNLGTLVGKEIKTRGGRTIHGFQGIPFAESPSGPNRFQVSDLNQGQEKILLENPALRKCSVNI
jgi:hypothetical protein